MRRRDNHAGQHHRGREDRGPVINRPGRSGPATPAALPETSNSTTGLVTIGHQQLRVDVRAGNGTGTPVLMCGGIGASFEVLQPLVDALDPGIDIIRFDVPGVGGSPVAALPHTFPQLARSWPAAGPDARSAARRTGL